MSSFNNMKEKTHQSNEKATKAPPIIVFSRIVTVYREEECYVNSKMKKIIFIFIYFVICQSYMSCYILFPFILFIEFLYSFCCFT